MHLLGSGTLSSPEFVSISRVLDTSQMDRSMSKLTSHGEPLLLASPISTISPSMTLLALQELNEYITSVNNVTRDKYSKASSADRFVAELLEEDQRLMDRVQIFRPLCAQGVGLHYRLVTMTNSNQQRVSGGAALATLSSLLCAYAKSKAPANSKERKIETPVAGILICVAMSGRPFAHSSSSLQYGISQRIEDCLGLLQSMGVSDVSAVQSLMSTLLITEDDYRKGNEIADAASITAIPESSEQALGKFANVANGQKTGAPIMGKVLKSTTSQVLKSTKRLTSATVNIATLGLLNRGLSGEVSLHIALNSSSADLARVMVERMRVLSVSENDTILSKYENSGTQRKANLDLTGTKSRRKKTIKTSKKNFIADLENFDYEGPTKSKKQRFRAALKSNAKSSGDLSDAASATMDTESVTSKLSGGGSKSAGLLRKPNEASSIMLRRSSATGGSKNVPTLMAPQRDFVASRRSSGSHGPKWEDGPSSRTLQTDDAKQKMQGRRATGDFSGNWNSASSDGTPTTFTGEMSSEASRSFSLGYDVPANGIPAPPTSRRIHVNIALNEDLSCSYKNSRMISCSVEGVIQVQVKSTSRVGIPYHLLLRDPSSHIQSLQENKKFAENIPVGDQTNGIDHRFAVSVPRGDNYFPLLRYKCSPDLRPVPIRVQTRIKTDSGFCRVALQISSNPHNEGSLTDLTIIMGVAEDILGETLITQPSGGVWNAAKRSVIWCVSELGDGEKFQLQARFEINANSNLVEPPKFPVLVRCQCMYAQLSDVEVEVCESDSHPAEVTMKTARRFRLSHQERS